MELLYLYHNHITLAGSFSGTMFACFSCKFETDVVSEFAVHLQTKHTTNEDRFLSSANPPPASEAKVKVELIPDLLSATTTTTTTDDLVSHGSIALTSDGVEEISIDAFGLDQVPC